MQIAQVNTVQGCTVFTMPAVLFCLLLASALSLSKGLRKGSFPLRLSLCSLRSISAFTFANMRRICVVASQKTILDVSEAARMPLVPCINAICEMQIAQVNTVQGCTVFIVSAGVFCALLASTPPLCKGLRKKFCSQCIIHN